MVSPISRPVDVDLDGGRDVGGLDLEGRWSAGPSGPSGRPGVADDDAAATSTVTFSPLRTMTRSTCSMLPRIGSRCTCLARASWVLCRRWRSPARRWRRAVASSSVVAGQRQVDRVGPVAVEDCRAPGRRGGCGGLRPCRIRCGKRLRSCFRTLVVTPQPRTDSGSHEGRPAALTRTPCRSRAFGPLAEATREAISPQGRLPEILPAVEAVQWAPLKSEATEPSSKTSWIARAISGAIDSTVSLGMLTGVGDRQRVGDDHLFEVGSLSRSRRGPGQDRVGRGRDHLSWRRAP